MHDVKQVTPHAVIAWYYFFEDKLPRMRPETSRQQLLETLALWKALTVRGGVPEFPADYAIDPELQARNEPEARALSESAAAERLRAIETVPQLKSWVYLIGVGGLFLAVVHGVAGWVRVAGWACVVFSALRLWAYLDERRRSPRGG